MKQHISGQLRLPQNKRQQLLHKNAGQFLLSLSRKKDAAEMLADRQTSTPASMLPMVF